MFQPHSLKAAAEQQTVPSDVAVQRINSVNKTAAKNAKLVKEAVDASKLPAA
jgi:hypothetical protein